LLTVEKVLSGHAAIKQPEASIVFFTARC